MKIYELSEQFQSLVEAVENEEVSAEAVQDTLESIEVELEEKYDNIGRVVKNYEATAKALKEEEARLAKKRKSIESKIKSIKDYANYNLQAMGKKSIQGDLFKVRIQKSPTSFIYDEEKIPQDYFIKQPDKLDKKSVQEDYKNGKKIDGIKEDEPKYHLRID